MIHFAKASLCWLETVIAIHPELLKESSCSRRKIHESVSISIRSKTDFALTCHKCNTHVQTGGRNVGSLHIHL